MMTIFMSFSMRGRFAHRIVHSFLNDWSRIGPALPVPQIHSAEPGLALKAVRRLGSIAPGGQ
ncbi:hypothetical protein [Rhizobium leguminosarum]|uniref:hypothetical protein n=1 Tax=Rhizobium leguminosarum TaxID=384 RepID=UPI001146E855|nr:hypothetical protein [Rhizobium leguminosarum]